MPSITIHPSPVKPRVTSENPLPQLLRTPSGLALLEVQGTFHFPQSDQSSTQVGKIVFPLYDPVHNDKADMKWMKCVYMYVGKGQRMTGECKKLGKPIAIIRKREKLEDVDGDTGMDDTHEASDQEQGEAQEELEIVEIVRFKLVFSHRPEPVSGAAEDVS